MGDPTSVELLTLTIERLQSLPILLVITFRPDFQPPWARATACHDADAQPLCGVSG